MDGSKRFDLSTYDWKKIGKGALIAMGGALMIYLGRYIQTGEFGDLTPLLTALGSALINMGHKYFTDTTA